MGSVASRRSYQARGALIEIGEPAVPVLIKALRRKDNVKKAIQILCALEERAVDHLVRLLDDKDEQTQSMAKSILKSMRNAKASAAVMRAEGGMEVLLNAIKFGPAEARAEAAKLLAKTGDERAVDALIGALDEPGYDRGTRWILTKALSDIGDARAVEALERSLRHLFPIRHPSPLVLAICRNGRYSSKAQRRDQQATPAGDQVRDEYISGSERRQRGRREMGHKGGGNGDL